jgi:hypothetical protein
MFYWIDNINYIVPIVYKSNYLGTSSPEQVFQLAVY